ncbi:MAG: hypothetical protein DWQ42_14430 [Planctomycetota bacterium]|nr:MAG: hypothetical protein DWQ42_14430 [Planctomycetota bacterium]
MNAESESDKLSARDANVPTGPLEVRPGCWMVGKRNPSTLLQCNTYLRTFESRGTKTNVCVDPGSQFDFTTIAENITQLTGGLDNIQALSLNHQDPDVVGNARFLFDANPDVTVMVTEETWRLVQHLLFEPKRVEFVNPVRSRLASVDPQNPWRLVPTPFCHFRGAMAFYDPEIRTLFSGDLFGGLNELGMVHLVADESDWAGIAQFHQIYMPSREGLRYAVRQIRALDPPVQVIAPQHGHVITGGLVPLFLERMHELLVGQDLLTVELDESYLKSYQEVFARMLARAGQDLGRREIAERLSRLGDDRLEQAVRVQGNHVYLDREAYSAVVKAFARLTTGEPPDFVNVLRDVVLTACQELSVPIPPIGTGVQDSPTTDYQVVNDPPTRPRRSSARKRRRS